MRVTTFLSESTAFSPSLPPISLTLWGTEISSRALGTCLTASVSACAKDTWESKVPAGRVALLTRLRA